MSHTPDPRMLGLPARACDRDGKLLSPSAVPLDALMDPDEIARFAESLAELTQTEATVIRYGPDTPSFLAGDGESRFVRGPICRELSRVMEGGIGRCVLDNHAVAHEAMRLGAPATGNCIGGDDVLYACPIVLHHGDAFHPKAAVCVAAHDIFRFHYADRLAEITGRPLAEVQDMLCHTDQRGLNARQLRRVRIIMETQASSFSWQISERYAELESMAVIASQRDQLNDAYVRLGHEYKLVGSLQRELVPWEPPDVPGYRIALHYQTARQAGGDYYDFFPFDDGRCGFVIADVSGHGPPAAVIMAVLRATMHACPLDMDAPAEVMAYANYQIYANTQAEHFTTGFYGILGPEGLCRFACCGHPGPLHYAAVAGVAREVPCGENGMPLGVMEDMAYEAEEIALAPGDVLLLYTDGIAEAADAVLEQYGAERLRAVVSAHGAEGAGAVRRAILDDVRRFADSMALYDDQTLVIIERTRE